MAKEPPHQTVLAPGAAFPLTTGYDVNDRPLVAPNIFLGKRTVLFVSFSINAFSSLESWETLFTENFGARQDLQRYIMPVLAGFTQVIKNISTPNIIKNVPEKKFGDALFAVYGDSYPIVKFLGAKDLEKAYVAVLNEQANLIFLCSGDPDPDKEARLAKAVS